MRRRHLWPDANKQATIEQTAKILREREEAAEQEQIITAKPQPPRFRGDNLAIQTYKGREFMLSGPSETGKTFATLWLLDSLLRSTSGVKATLARKVQSSIYGTVLVTWQRILDYQESLGGAHVTPIGGNQPKLYIYPNGSRLWVGGMDHSNKILSGERDYIYVNQAEEFTLEDWEVCHTRTTGRGGVVSHPMTFGDCNPGPEDHWILKRETLKIFRSKHEDNPSLFTDAGILTPQGIRTMQTLDSLTGIRKKRLRYGQWVGAEGLYFENFDPEPGGLHVCEPHDIPEDALIWGALDWGWSHPLAFGLFTENDEGIELIWEHVQSKWLIPHHARAIYRGLERLKIAPWRLSQIVAGHDAFSKRGGATEDEAKSWAQKFAEAVDPETREPLPIILEPADINRVQGWGEIMTRLGNPDPLVAIRPTIKIWSTCTRTIATLSRLVHNPRDPEDVLKVGADVNGDGGDDAGDMLRYGVMVRANQPGAMPAVAGTRGGYVVR